jgi:hypothetical protein
VEDAKPATDLTNLQLITNDLNFLIPSTPLNSTNDADIGEQVTALAIKIAAAGLLPGWQVG